MVWPKRNKKNSEDNSSTYGNAVGVLLSDAFGLGLALLEGVLVLELAAHGDGSKGH